MGTDHIRFIGTGSAQASMERFHSAFVLTSREKYCLIDAGDGVSRALVSQNIPFKAIHSIIISHMHPDHFSGLAGLLIQMKLVKRTEELLIYVHESLQDAISGFIKIFYLFTERLGFNLLIRPYTSDEFFHPLDDLEVLARQNSHLDDYIKNSPGGLSFSCSSYLFNFHNRLIFYTGDIGSEEDLYLFDDYNFDIMISEVTHIEHKKILNAFRASGAKKLYLTHLSQGDSVDSASEKGEIIIAYDGLTIPI